MNLHRFWKEESTVTIQSLAELIILEGKKEVYYFIARSHPANKTRNSPFPCYFTNRKLSVLTGTYYFLLEHTIFILLVQNSTLKVKQKTAKHPRKMFQGSLYTLCLPTGNEINVFQDQTATSCLPQCWSVLGCWQILDLKQMLSGFPQPLSMAR